MNIWGLIPTPKDGTLQKKCRKFINDNVKIISPIRTDRELELLVQKNLFLIDFGFIYFIDSLLKRLLGN